MASEVKKSQLRGYWEAVRYGHKPSSFLQEIQSTVSDEGKLLALAQERIAHLPSQVKRVLPDRKYYDRYQPKRSMFLVKLQLSDHSPHNITHMAGTEILAGLIGTTVLIESPESEVKVSEAVAGGAIHDTQRLNNHLESAVALGIHGVLASKRDSLYREVSTERKIAVKRYVRYHDTKEEKLPEDLKTDPTFATLQLADALGMVRFVADKSRFKWVQAIAEQVLENKLVDFHTGSPYFAEKLQEFWPIAAALYTQGEKIGLVLKEEWQNQLHSLSRRDSVRRKELQRLLHGRVYQYEGMIKAGEMLGIIAS